MRPSEQLFVYDANDERVNDAISDRPGASNARPKYEQLRGTLAKQSNC